MKEEVMSLMKRVIEYFILGVLMIGVSSMLSGTSLSSISSVFSWSGILVLTVGEILFVYKSIMKVYHMYQDFISHR